MSKTLQRLIIVFCIAFAIFQVYAIYHSWDDIVAFTQKYILAR